MTHFDGNEGFYQRNSLVGRSICPCKLKELHKNPPTTSPLLLFGDNDRQHVPANFKTDAFYRPALHPVDDGIGRICRPSREQW